MKKIFTFLMMTVLFGILNAQTTTIFTESMGTGATGNPSVSTYTGFQNYGTLTFSGTADVRTTTPSTGYSGASGSNNVYISNAAGSVGLYFTISGINTLDYENLVLSFGFYKSGTAAISNSDLNIEVCSDYNTATNTGTFTPLTFTVTTGAAWSLVTPSGTIPSVANLAIRFRQNQLTQNFRLDDVKLTGTSATPTCQFFEDFENKGTENGTYTGTNVTFGTGSWFIAGMTTMDGNDRFNGARSIRLRGNAGDNCYLAMNFNKPNGLGTLTFKYGSYSTHSGGKISSYYSTNGGTTWIFLGEVVSPAWSGSLIEASYNVDVPGNVRIKIAREGDLATGTTVNIDDICITDFGITTVAAPTFAPPSGIYKAPQNITLTSTTTGAAIYYTINGGDPTTSSTLYTAPFPLTAVGTYTVKAIAVKTGMDNSTITSATYTLNECDRFEDFETMAGSGSYTGATVTFASGQWYVAGLTTMDGNDRYNGLRSIRLRGNDGDNCHIASLFDFPNGIDILKFKYGSYSTHANGQISVYYSTNAGVTWTHVESFIVPSWANAGNQLLTANIGVYVPGNVRIKIARDGALANGTTVNVDDICILDFGSSPIVAPPKFSPIGGIHFSPVNVTISCPTVGSTIHYTTDGTTPTTSSPTYSTPIPVSATTTVKALAVKAGMDDSPVTSVTYTIPIEVPNIAAFKAANPATSSVPYKITGNVTFVYRSNSSITNVGNRYIYIKDATGGLLIFDNTTSVVTKTYNNGDVISGGVIGTATIYNGLCELIPLTDLAVGTPGTPVTPITLTMADLVTNFPNYESQLVRLETVQFDNGEFTAATASNINIHQNSSDMVCRSHYGGIDFTANPAKRFHVTGFAIPFNAEKQIAPRTISDIVEPEFTVTFLNWNNSVISTKTDYHYGDVVVVPANPTRPSTLVYNYTFKAWSPAVVSPVVGNATYIATYDSAYINYTLTVLASPTTSGNATGGGNTFHYGDNVTITATANPGYHFVNWNDGNTTNPRTVTITGNATYTAFFEPNEYILYLNASPGTVSPTQIPVFYGVQVGTIPTPVRTGYNHAGWFTGVNGTGTQITETTVWNTLGNLTVNAYWLPKTYTLTLDPGTGTCGTASVLKNYGATILPLPAASQLGCNFLGWTIDGVMLTPSTQWTWDDNKTAVAVFNCPIAVTVVGSAYGTVTPSGTMNYLLGDNPTYTFTPNTGAHVASVVVSNYINNMLPLTPTTTLTGNPELTQTLTHNFISNKYYAVTATFAPNCYAMNPTNEIPPSIQTSLTVPPSVTPVTCVQHGLSAVVNFASSSCTAITNVWIEGAGNLGSITSYPLGAITGPLPKIIVTTNDQTFNIIATVNDSSMGNISSPGTTTFNCAESKTYLITPNIGFKIVSVTVDGVNNPAAVISGTYTFNNIDANHTIHVVFEEIIIHIIQFGPAAFQNAGGVVYPTNDPTALYYVEEFEGTNVPFSIVPNPGYMIDKVFVDNIANNQALSGSYTFYNVVAPHTIYATFKHITHTITATTSGGGNILPGGAVQVNQGDDQTFQIIPETGYDLVSVIVDGAPLPSPTNTYTFPNVVANHTIHATFAIQTFTITATAEENGSITPEGEITVNYGASQTFTITPDFGYQIDKVFIDGVNNPAAAMTNTYTFTGIASDHTINVTFKKLIFTITASCNEGGTLQPTGIEFVPYNEHSVIYVFDALPEHHVEKVLIDNEEDLQAKLDGMYRFLNVSQNHKIQVFFAPNKHTIVATATQGGAISPMGVVTVAHGSDKTFFFTAETGYHLVRVIIDGFDNEEALAAGKYTFMDIVANHTIYAHFAINWYTITLPDVPGAHIFPETGYTSPVKHGDKFMFTVNLEADYNQSIITVRSNDLVIVPSGNVYTLLNIMSDQNVTIEGVEPNTKGVEENSSSSLKVYSYGNVVTIDNKELLEIRNVEIMDMYGRVVWQGQAAGTKTEISLQVATGIYGVRIATEKGFFIEKVSITR